MGTKETPGSNVPTPTIKHPWIVVDATKDGAYVCKRCQAIHHQTYPISIGMMAATAKQFVREHKNCKEVF